MDLEIGVFFQNAAPDIKFQIYLDELLLVEMRSDGLLHHICQHCNDNMHTSLHRLCLVMSGKAQNHTKLDLSGQIVSDCAVIVKFIKFNGIDITYLVCEGARCYHHDNNGITDSYIDKFFGYMGQNGQVILDFESPLHLWFLKQCL